MFLQAHLHLFYPLNLLLLGLAERGQHIPHLVLQYHHLVHYALAGIFTYLYARQLGLGRFAGSISGIAFMFSGFMLAHVTHWTMIDTFAWLPAILACLVRADVSQRLRWGSLGGLAMGMAFLAGHPQLFYHIGLATVALGFTLVLRRAGAGEPWRRRALILLLVPLVALGVSAVQLVPSWAVALASNRAALGYDWKTTGSLAPAYLTQAVLPWGLLPPESSRPTSSEFHLYPGILTLVLAIHALARRWDWRVGFHAAVGFGALLLAFGDEYGLYRPAYDLLPGLAFFRIPARFVGLVGFTVAVLAGIGAEAVVTGPRPHRLARGLRRLSAVAGAGLVPVALIVVWARSLPNPAPFWHFASQYVLLALFLTSSALVVSWPGRVGPRTLRAAMLAVLLADLLFGSYMITGGPDNPDVSSPREREWAAAINRTPGPVRLARGPHIRPQEIYRHGWGVIDGKSAFAPPAFLELHALSRDNPRVLDLLGVRYLLPPADPPSEPTRGAAPLRVWDGTVRRFPLPPGGPGRQLELHSHLTHGRDLPQGAVVATMHAVAADGRVTSIPLRAGVETAEWALDRPGTPGATGDRRWRDPGRFRTDTTVTRTGRPWTFPGAPGLSSSFSRGARESATLRPPRRCWSSSA